MFNVMTMLLQVALMQIMEMHLVLKVQSAHKVLKELKATRETKAIAENKDHPVEMSFAKL